jgi:NAD(P)H-dependent flavin oxidoreductase YrpB (nitropropane dioxygenase family)
MPVIHTPLCDLPHIEVPIIQAPIGSATTPALAARSRTPVGWGCSP